MPRSLRVVKGLRPKWKGEEIGEIWLQMMRLIKYVELKEILSFLTQDIYLFSLGVSKS